MNWICGYWMLDGGPMDAAALPRMLGVGIRGETQAPETWNSDDHAIAFAAASWSPQAGLRQAECIARHPQSGCVAIADARLDNPEQLRTALGLAAADTTPAGLLLQAWLHWGEDCVARIDGDFAFAIHDPRRQSLFIARDRMGVRPLYVHHQPGKRLVFGTSSQAVLAHPQVPGDLNQARIADYLLELAGQGLEGLDFTSTFHAAVQRHPPRHATTTTPRGQHSRQYWALQPNATGMLPRSDGEWVEALDAVLEGAISRQRRGTGRIGSMLSGGMDSTALAMIAADQLQAAGAPPLPTFSAIDSSHADCPETRAVLACIQRPGLQPHLFDIARPGTLQHELDSFLDGFDEPFDMGMALLDAQYLNAARAGVDAVIDGIDGDTLFSATGVVQHQVRSGNWSAAWANIRGMQRIWNGSLPQYLRMFVLSGLTPDWLRRMRTRQQQRTSAIPDTPMGMDFLARHGIADRLRQYDLDNTLVATLDPVARRCHTLMRSLHASALERYHRIAARHGVTPLHPFFDRRVLELGVHVPGHLRLRDGRTKAILREAMRGRMPEAVRLRTDKSHLGWKLTTRLWDARTSGLQQRLEGTDALTGIIDPQQLQSLRHAPASLPAASRIFLGQLAHWLRRHDRKPGPTPGQGA